MTVTLVEVEPEKDALRDALLLPVCEPDAEVVDDNDGDGEELIDAVGDTDVD